MRIFVYEDGILSLLLSGSFTEAELSYWRIAGGLVIFIWPDGKEERIENPPRLYEPAGLGQKPKSVNTSSGTWDPWKGYRTKREER